MINPKNHSFPEKHVHAKHGTLCDTCVPTTATYLRMVELCCVVCVSIHELLHACTLCLCRQVDAGLLHVPDQRPPHHHSLLTPPFWLLPMRLTLMDWLRS